MLDRLHEAIRLHHYSRRTEEAYTHWVKRFIYFNDKRHPADLGEVEVTNFLNHLATSRGVSASTQNQALSALLFLALADGERALRDRYASDGVSSVEGQGR